ncbi:MAG: hypothetical protein M3Y50_12135 [Acidobacteriota bacterium]|nr:hypothetical protein [Acidobacteriota bacterium]
MRSMTLGLLIGLAVGAVLSFAWHSLALGVMVAVPLGWLLGKAISKYHPRSRVKTLFAEPARTRPSQQREEI